MEQVSLGDQKVYAARYFASNCKQQTAAAAAAIENKNAGLVWRNSRGLGWQQGSWLIRMSLHVSVHPVVRKSSATAATPTAAAAAAVEVASGRLPAHDQPSWCHAPVPWRMKTPTSRLKTGFVHGIPRFVSPCHPCTPGVRLPCLRVSAIQSATNALRTPTYRTVGI